MSIFVSSYEIFETKVINEGQSVFGRRRKCNHSKFKAISGHYRCDYCLAEFNPCLRCKKPFNVNTLEKGQGYCGRCTGKVDRAHTPIIPAKVVETTGTEDVKMEHVNLDQSRPLLKRKSVSVPQSNIEYEDEPIWRRKWAKFHSNNYFNYSHWSKK